MYDYKAKIVRWHDGDTALVDIDLGFGVGIRAWIRLVDCWALELGETGGAAPLALAERLAPAGGQCYVVTRKLDDKAWFEAKQLPQTFARYLGTIYPAHANGGSVNELLVLNGLATRTRTA